MLLFVKRTHTCYIEISRARRVIVRFARWTTTFAAISRIRNPRIFETSARNCLTRYASFFTKRTSMPRTRRETRSASHLDGETVTCISTILSHDKFILIAVRFLFDVYLFPDPFLSHAIVVFTIDAGKP